jgi:lysophospholipase L1-like esterase
VNLTPSPLSAGNHTLQVNYQVVAGSYRGDAVFQGLVLDSGATTFAPPAPGKLIEFVGDSITVGSEDELVAAFTELGLDDAEINAESGRRMVVDQGITSGLDGVADVLAEGDPPDLWVIALGSNDVAGYAPEEYAGAIDELLAAIPAGAPIVWVDCYLTNYVDESVAFDTTLRQVLAARGNATVVDWATMAPQDGVLSDNVHPSPFGRLEFARRVADGVDAWIN